MLEVKDLVKTYKTKGGAQVRALDGVSAAFADRGMVFLLGKSGSGKSTLLNVCGGLDAPDSGEVVIKGRSSRDFTPADFDSYRNTFVGFVFQEYNILNEFSVEDNIALALELQGKGRDGGRVREILEQVEMQDFARRKPNTLSGGQKQRVAIARALVKNPEIIMADEPTGALDSVTGRQVLETLKKLSAQKLVIVVSHDREFAETYGDRIIELKDGKIISDVTKESLPPVTVSDNLSFAGGDTITVKSGSALTPADVERINEFLRTSPKDLIISCGEREISAFKRATGMSDDGSRERFRATRPDDAPAREYGAEEGAFIRSRLPFRHAVRIGASGLKVKPLRLFFTILLSFIAFSMFGLFSTLTFYDRAAAATETYLHSGYAQLPVEKMYSYTYISYVNGEETWRRQSSRATPFTPADYAAMREKYGDKTIAAFDFRGTDGGRSYAVSNAGNMLSAYYTAAVAQFAVFAPDAWRDDIRAGRADGLADDEIVISSYLFDGLAEAGLTDGEGNAVRLTGYEDIVGATIELNTDNGYVPLKVAGVFGCDPPEKYDALKTSADDYFLRSDFNDELSAGYYLTALVGDGFYEAHRGQFEPPAYEGRNYSFSYLNTELRAVRADGQPSGDKLFALGAINSLPVQDGDAPVSLAFADDRTTGTLAGGEAALPFWYIRSAAEDVVRAGYAKLAAEAEALGDGGREEAMAAAKAWLGDLMTAIDMLDDGTYAAITGGAQTNRTASPEQLEDAVGKVMDALKEYGGEGGGLNFTLYPDGSSSPCGTFAAVAFIYGREGGDLNGAYFSGNDFAKLKAAFGAYESPDKYTSEAVTNYVQPEDAIYRRIIVPFPQSSRLLRALAEGETGLEGADTFTSIDTPLSYALSSVSDTVDILSEIFLWVGVAMAAFAMLLLFNFISVSITYKKREIGILRAVGARSADVFRIFYAESAIIAAICFTLAMVAGFVICGVLNDLLAGTLGVSIFVFGPLSWLVMLGIAAVTSFAATFLPVYNIARRRPVDSIRAL